MRTVERIGNGTILVTDGELKYIEFECLNKFSDMITHCMSTRIGGVSAGECSALNMGFNRNDSRENVLENYRLLCKSAGIDTQSLVLTNQVHETIIQMVDDSDKGKGIWRDNDIKGVDGLLTVTPGVTLVTFYADCVPIFLFEPGIKAIALLHSGWKGTLKSIVSEALKAMARLPGFKVERLVAAIGPSIGSCCFEVGEDVYRLFAERYKDVAFYKPSKDGKWKIDLQGIIETDLIREGLLDENIHNSGVCTKCRKDLFFSHRGDNGKTGSLAAFMQINAVRSIK